MNSSVVRRKAQIPVREVRRRLPSFQILMGVVSGLLAVPAFLLFAGRTGQTQVPVTPEKTGEYSKLSTLAQWVPFVANRFQESTPDWPGHRPEKIVLAGPYMRNQQGSSYQRLRVVSKNSVRIVIRDVATIYDRPKGLTYLIDYAHHTIEVERQTSEDLFLRVKDPLTREQFAASHASDQYLGISTFEGFECEIYKIRGKGKKNKFDETVCYAPALNFLAVRAQYHPPQGVQSETYFTEIQIGRKPGPEYFQMPEGFKIIDKTK